MLVELLLSVALAVAIIPFTFQYHQQAVERAENIALTKQMTMIQDALERYIIANRETLLKTVGKTVEDMVLVEELAMKMALGENPKRVYGNSKTSPSTRMASAALLREWLFKAKKYYEKKKQYNEDLLNGKDKTSKIFYRLRHTVTPRRRG